MAEYGEAQSLSARETVPTIASDMGFPDPHESLVRTAGPHPTPVSVSNVRSRGPMGGAAGDRMVKVCWQRQRHH